MQRAVERGRRLLRSAQRLHESRVPGARHTRKGGADPQVRSAVKVCLHRFSLLMIASQRRRRTTAAVVCAAPPPAADACLDGLWLPGTPHWEELIVAALLFGKQEVFQSTQAGSQSCSCFLLNAESTRRHHRVSQVLSTFQLSARALLSREHRLAQQQHQRCE